MITRRKLLSVAGVVLAPSCGPRSGPLREFRVGVVTEENEADRVKRYSPLAKHLTGRLGLPAELRQASDYAGIVEAMRNGQMELAYFGPAAYAKAWLLTGGMVTPLAAPYDLQGQFGMYSVIVVRANRPWRSLEDLRGRSLAFADPNSTTGFQAPSFYLRKQGIDPAAWFSKTVFSGSHEASILGLLDATYDAAATWTTNKERGNIQRMEGKGMIPAGRTRVVWESPRLPPNTWTIRSQLPAPLKESVRGILMKLRDEAPNIWKSLTDGLEGGYREVTHADYADIVAMIQANLSERRRGG